MQNQNNLTLSQLKESLGEVKYNKIRALITECLNEGLEVEITIPRDSKLNEGIFGNKNALKGTKGKNLTGTIYTDSDINQKLRPLTKGLSAFQDILGTYEMYIQKDIITFNIKNDVNAVKKVISVIKDLFLELNEKYPKILKDKHDINVVVEDEKGNEVDIGYVTDAGGFRTTAKL